MVNVAELIFIERFPSSAHALIKFTVKIKGTDQVVMEIVRCCKCARNAVFSVQIFTSDKSRNFQNILIYTTNSGFC